MIHRLSFVRFWGVALSIGLLSGACTNTLTYGESTGLNLGIEADLATDTPAEINVGFKRRVIGMVPALQDPQNGRVTGEAANILSRFEIDSESNPEAVFDTTLKVRGAFASGAAATGLIVDNNKGAEIVVQLAQAAPVVARVPDDPVQRSASERLTAYVAESPENRDRYLSLAEEIGLNIPDNPFPSARATDAINDPANASGNQRILTFLGI